MLELSRRLVKNEDSWTESQDLLIENFLQLRFCTLYELSWWPLKMKSLRNTTLDNHQADMSREKSISYLTSATESTIIKEVIYFSLQRKLWLLELKHHWLA